MAALCEHCSLGSAVVEAGSLSSFVYTQPVCFEDLFSSPTSLFPLSSCIASKARSTTLCPGQQQQRETPPAETITKIGVNEASKRSGSEMPHAIPQYTTVNIQDSQRLEWRGQRKRGRTDGRGPRRYLEFFARSRKKNFVNIGAQTENGTKLQ